MNTAFKVTGVFFVALGAGHAQVVPSANGLGGPALTGDLSYALRYSQSAQFSSLDNRITSSPSASISYSNENHRLPFSLNYAGGYTWTEAGSPYSTGLFQHLAFSQGFVWSKWNLAVSDDVSYRPQSPTTGFSGIPGIGEPIGQLGSVTTGQSVLTVNTHTVSNIASGEIGHSFNHWASMNAGGSFDLLRYPDENGLDTNARMANASLDGRLDARNSISGSYLFSQFSYPLNGISFTTNSGLVGYKRAWSRKITSNISVGPQWTASSSGASIPSSTNVAANAAINYKFRSDSAGLSYNRGVEGGSGYMFGAESDSFSGNLSRQFGRDLQIGIEGSYRRMAGLQKSQLIQSAYGGLQGSRRFGRYLSAFANYTAMNQLSNSPLPANALSRLVQVVGFGIEFSPRETHLKQ